MANCIMEKQKLILILFLCCLRAVNSGFSGNNSVLSENEVNEIIFEKLKEYDPRKRANIDEILNVMVNINVLSITNLRQEDMQYSLRKF